MSRAPFRRVVRRSIPVLAAGALAVGAVTVLPNVNDPGTTLVDPDAVSTHFETLPAGAGGFVTGLSFSDDGRTRLVATDAYGGYTWAGDRWRQNVDANAIPENDWAPRRAAGVLDTAVAPSDRNRAYMAYGSAFFRSDDGGTTWQRVIDEISTESNDDFRTWGPRIVVDPLDADVVYFGSQLDGLLVSRDGGRQWTRVAESQVPHGASFSIKDPAARGDLRRPSNPLGDRDIAAGGVTSIVVDRDGPAIAGRSARVYAAVFGKGVFTSGDGGTSWVKMTDPGLRSVSQLDVLGNGDLIAVGVDEPTDLTSPSAVWRYRDGSWTNVTPPKAVRWRSVARDPFRENAFSVAAPGIWMATSSDAGASWEIDRSAVSGRSDVSWLDWALTEGNSWMSLGEIVYDPVREGRLWLAEGIGVWYTDEPSPETGRIEWTGQSRGIEELVTNDVIAPPEERPVGAAWDRAIFRLGSDTEHPETYGPTAAFSSAWSLDWSAFDDYLVSSVATHHWPFDPRQSGYSEDGGRSWTSFPTIPTGAANGRDFGFGTVAVGSAGNVVWAPAYGKRPHYTTDGGATWSPIQLPGVSDYSKINRHPHYVRRQPLAADRTEEGTFYLFAFGEGFFVTRDGGRTWAKQSDATGFSWDFAWNVQLENVPGQPGHLFMSAGPLSGDPVTPFRHSLDGGATWRDVPNISSVTAFGFGAPMPGSEEPTIFAHGTVDGNEGVYRSMDGGSTWLLLERYPAGRFADITSIDGDKDVPGVVYLGLVGNGWVRGAPVVSLDSPAEPEGPGDSEDGPDGGSDGGPAIPDEPQVTVPPTTPSDDPVVGEPSSEPKAPEDNDPSSQPSPDSDAENVPDSPEQELPSLRAKIQAPKFAQEGRRFRVAVDVEGADSYSVLWNTENCGIARPRARRTWMRCRTDGLWRDNALTAQVVAGDNEVTERATVRTKPRQVKPWWSKPRVADDVFRSRIRVPHRRSTEGLEVRFEWRPITKGDRVRPPWRELTSRAMPVSGRIKFDVKPNRAADYRLRTRSTAGLRPSGTSNVRVW